MKINDKILSIPPFISTYWSNVSALHMKGQVLVISLLDGETIEVQNLAPEIINHIFSTHANHLEKEYTQETPSISPTNVFQQFSEILKHDPQAEPMFRMSIGNLDELGSVLHHNSQQSNSPDIPKEILSKIAAITKIFSPEEMTIPKAEPHCNCTHCQIARTLGQSLSQEATAMAEIPKIKAVPEEEISDKELQFQQWDVIESGNQLYTVTNRLDSLEKYSVFLGTPVGCTCGNPNCEHIVAVLKT
jgi:hypothetical protein